ncbi:MAG: hypothetical protein CSA81_12440 [Acidobacteria bacterium]|nr:MAG: hypothetical protein CSA81_12440 [Acidobacteriota bacterium]
MTFSEKISYVFMVLTLVVFASIKLIGVFLVILFSYLALTYLQFKERKWVGIVLYFFLVTLIFYSFGFVINRAIVVIPGVVEEAVPKIVGYAQEQNIELPFKDIESLKTVSVETVTKQLASFASFAKVATKQFVFIIIALVMVISLFIRDAFSPISKPKTCQTLMEELKVHISSRFSTFYDSFRVVMGAQVIISAINTVLTGIYALVAGVPYPFIIVFFTFICGLLPVIGNVLSNTLIVGISLTVSVKLTIVSLIFLVVIHKLEYFLNSKIIGGRIKTPMWLTLLGLALGEKLMGIPGMVIAPVILHYVKIELSQIPAGTLAPFSQQNTGETNTAQTTGKRKRAEKENTQQE